MICQRWLHPYHKARIYHGWLMLHPLTKYPIGCDLCRCLARWSPRISNIYPTFFNHATLYNLEYFPLFYGSCSLHLNWRSYLCTFQLGRFLLVHCLYVYALLTHVAWTILCDRSSIWYSYNDSQVLKVDLKGTKISWDLFGCS